MNPPIERGDNDQTDALLFEYLEGTLSADSAKVLEERLAAEPGLQLELEYWKEAFIEADVYDTQQLEESLLRPPVNGLHPAISAAVFMVAFLTSVLSFLPLSPKEERAVPFRPLGISASMMVPGEKQPAGSTPQPASKASLLSRHSMRKTSALATVQPFTPSEKWFTVELLRPKVLPLAVTQPESGLTILDGRINRIGLKKTLIARIITRKQQRKIERMKEKARQERAASQFLKGRVPYVVPLNTNNF